MLVVYLIGAGIVGVLAYLKLTRRSRMRAKGLREEAKMRRQSVKTLAQIIRRSNDSVGSDLGK
jgi:hypothetical protein